LGAFLHLRLGLGELALERCLLLRIQEREELLLRVLGFRSALVELLHLIHHGLVRTATTLHRAVDLLAQRLELLGVGLLPGLHLGLELLLDLLGLPELLGAQRALELGPGQHPGATALHAVAGSRRAPRTTTRLALAPEVTVALLGARRHLRTAEVTATRRRRRRLTRPLRVGDEDGGSERDRRSEAAEMEETIRVAGWTHGSVPFGCRGRWIHSIRGPHRASNGPCIGTIAARGRIPAEIAPAEGSRGF